ncbi:endopeptidase La [Anaerosphaera multitolerans]|uniref:Lon protease n=1 Tax=Anaerosphaera multitolerans TaxID=2487351 RepID=A0A437S4D7_9FIRM|nr:endopeptidase La [Anaerosphaera multitolerans]RVU53871.1 endopeptidase La [Anaerosphaera multitolerans]
MDKKSKLPVIPLRDLIIFPRMVTHFDCGREKSIAAIEAAEMKESTIFVTGQIDAAVADPKREDLYQYGVVAKIKQILKLPGGIVRVLVEGLNRAKIEELFEEENYLEAVVEEFEEEVEDREDKEVMAAIRLIEEDLERYSELDSRLVPGLLQSVVDKTSASTLVDTSAAYINLQLDESQRLLEELNPYNRLLLFHGILQREIEMLSIEKNIDQRVRSNMNKVQREYYLKEQLKVIHEELGDASEEGEILTYQKRIEEKLLPEAVRERALKEVSKLSKTNTASPEYTVILNYLDWILDLPWLESSPDEIDLNEARKILDREHYGLKNVKERILEFIAVKKLAPESKGSILCLVGPPGVGKTSIASSIANALGKSFVRMSLGGVTDEAEIRGHRRTYVGALPGRIITLLKKAKENNPVFLFDEIDKVGTTYRGDPASGLLEVLDPEQNKTFTDHYMELPFDLSNVFFVTTANTTQTIPRPLLDRMEVINLGGYTPDEKYNIAKKYLLPKQLKENGLKKSQFTMSDTAIKDIINFYTREAGVRALEKEISKCARKAALQIVEEGKEKISVTSRNINKFLGEKKYLFDIVEKEDQVGVVNGLAWTEVGGETLAIESTIMPGSGKLTLTGQLGDVMKESAIAAVSYLASNSSYYNLEPDFRKELDIHIHVPEGAVPKDGPSAGITIATSVLSALTDRPVKKDVAMTGEITLRGRVLPIGGLKEKILAAQRMGIKTVIIPQENERDLAEIEKEVLDTLTVIPVKEMKDVEKIALGDKK